MPGGKPGTLKQMWNAVRQLNPGMVVEDAERRFTIALVAGSEGDIAAMKAALAGPADGENITPIPSRFLSAFVRPDDDARIAEARKADLIFAAPGAESGVGSPEKVILFDPADPARAFSLVLSRPVGYDLRLALGHRFPGLRSEVSRRVIADVSRENATFAVLTALGSVVPTVFQPLLGITEAAGDMVVLTANQVRMLFSLGAVYGMKVGYITQWPEISSIVGAAFGWRSIARNLISKIPFGGGLVPKGAIAYAGTYAVGEGARIYYATGRRMDKAEMTEAFKRSYSEAVEFVRGFVGKLKTAAPVEGSQPGDESSSSGT